jgi:hypothetical protein
LIKNLKFDGCLKVAYNVLGLGEVGEIEAQMLNYPLMLIEIRMFKFSTSAPILPNPCVCLDWQMYS